MPEDKPRIAELLKKPWNPYIRRHSALTEKSMILKESVLRQHAGWKPDSDIGLSIKIEKGEIFIKGVLYFNGFPIKITDRYVEAGPLRLSGSTFTNGINGLSIDLGH